MAPSESSGSPASPASLASPSTGPPASRADPSADPAEERDGGLGDLGVVEVVVIGAGQAGLSAAGHLVRKGLRPGEDFVVLDADDGPGGAWRHRWDSLTFDTAHGINDLPGFPLGTPDPTEPASRVVSRYYGAYEDELDLQVVRPARVRSVEGRAPDSPDTRATEDPRDRAAAFTVTTEDGARWRARAVINATGTWESPYLPYYPGAGAFTGRQLHTRDFVAPEEFTGRRVLVVGGGTSALQFLLQLDASGAQTVWTTRSPPQWTDKFFDSSWGRDVETSVMARTTRGLPPLSVVAATGLPVTDQYLQGLRGGVLVSRGPLRRLTERGAVLDGPGPDGGAVPSQGPVADAILDGPGVTAPPQLPGHRPSSASESTVPASSMPAQTPDRHWEVPVDDVLWATGFRASLDHLSPLQVRERGGGVLMDTDGVSVVKQPGLFLVGYGASASTIGATRAGRRAALATVGMLEGAAA